MLIDYSVIFPLLNVICLKAPLDVPSSTHVLSSILIDRYKLNTTAKANNHGIKENLVSFLYNVHHPDRTSLKTEFNGKQECYISYHAHINGPLWQVIYQGEMIGWHCPLAFILTLIYGMVLNFIPTKKHTLICFSPSVYTLEPWFFSPVDLFNYNLSDVHFH